MVHPFSHSLFASFACAVLGFLSLLSCQSHEGSDTQLKEDADSFATHYYNWHFEQAMRYCSPGSEKWLRYAASNVRQADIELLRAKASDATVEVGDIDFLNGGDSATVSVTVSDFLRMDTIGTGATPVGKATFLLPMVIHEGKWKVVLDGMP